MIIKEHLLAMERIKKIIKKLCLEEIEDDEELLESKRLNSFQLLEMICELETAYGIEFSPDEIGEIDHFSSINHIWELISEKLTHMDNGNRNK